MLSQVKSVLQALRMPSRAEVERQYLNDAVNLYDLECRQRQIDQGVFRKSY